MPQQDFLEDLRQQRIERGPMHHFQNLQDSERLSYELLTANNYQHIVELFANDDNTFVDYRFKIATEAQKYTSSIVDSVYDNKHGGCDFLVKLKSSETYIGILHLFDFSLETFSDVQQRCTIGCSIAQSFRRKYYATEAVLHLIDYAKMQHSKTKILAYTKIENSAANAFLQSIAMVLANEDYHYGGQEDNYYVLDMTDK
jgi:RimJ/RimL family protein N-acetyltransferase